MNNSPTSSNSAATPEPIRASVGAPSSSAPVHKTSKEAKAIQQSLAKYANELRAVTTTTETHEQCVKLYLESAMQTGKFLAVGWVSVPLNGIPSLDEVLFANATINNDQVRNQVIEFSTAAASGQQVSVFESEKVRGVQFVGVPIYQDEKTTAVVCGMFAAGQKGVEQSSASLQQIALSYDLWRARDQLTSMVTEVRSTASVLELIEKAQCAGTRKEACIKIANELQAFLRCDYVAVGLKQPGKHGCHLQAISSLADYDSNSKTTTLFNNCFDEAIVSGGYTVFPASETANRGSSLSHKKLASHLRCASTITMPLRNDDEEVVGAITMLGNVGIDRTPATRNLIQALEHPLGSTLDAVSRIEGGPMRRFARFFKSKHKTKTSWLIYGGLIFAMLAMFFPIAYRVHCDCVAEPVVRSFIVAPYEGLLESTWVEPGTVVEKGQLLAKMDGREIRIESTGKIAEREQALKKYDAHLARQEIADADRARLEAAQLDTELELLGFRQQNLEIASPVDGFVLSGSLDRRENYPVSRGETLYEIAPLNPLRVELAIPADEIMHVEIGQTVKFRFDGFGTETTQGVIRLIRPSSTIREDQNVFIAEAELDNENGLVRPGMKGKARVMGTRKTLGWTIFHHPWEKLVTAIGF